MKLEKLYEGRIKELLNDYFEEKQGKFDYTDITLKDRMEYELKNLLRKFCKDFEDLDNNIDAYLAADSREQFRYKPAPTYTQMRDAYDAWREDELANGGR